LITVPDAPTHKEKAAKIDKIDISELESDEVQFVIKTVMDKISQLTEITIALEERLLNVETKKVSAETTAADITELKEKISSLENQLEVFSIDTDRPIDETVFDETKISEMTETIPVPSLNDISTTTEKDTSFEALDRTSLESMEILEENNDEERITDILKETEKDEIIEDVDSVQLEAPPKKEVEKKPKKDKEVKTKAAKARCPKCGSKLSYIKQYDRWYCYRCKIYV
ncbi:MAG: transposase, partial [Candidatus Heimdallarchaeota archaeon]|nr:transposase [Candidatus Heimdallarchaeota archaeon]